MAMSSLSSSLSSSFSSTPSLWKFGGLTPILVTQRAVKKIGDDELSTRSASLSYYFILALFPMLLFIVSLIGLFAGSNSELRATIFSQLGHLAPGSSSDLIQTVVSQTAKSSSALKIGFGILGALWAASAGVTAVIESLNVVYEYTERRPWWKQKLSVLGLTVGLAVLIILAIVLVLYGGKIGTALASHFGLGHLFTVIWSVVQWPVLFGAMFLSFALVYFLGPDAPKPAWHWVTPGAALGVVLWLVASLGFRIYLHFFNSYSATYGSLGAVIILLLWLYLTGFAILIGAELNAVIEAEDRHQALHENAMKRVRQKLQAA